MARALATILEIHMKHTDTGQNSLGGRIACHPSLHVSPGQYMLATCSDEPDFLPTVLFPSREENGGFELSPPLPVTWTAGMRLAISGPLGHGFNLPIETHRVAVAAFEDNLSRLYPLIFQALSQKADVAVYTDSKPEDLPPLVEILPMALLSETAGWATFMAISAPCHMLSDLRASLGLKVGQPPPCLVEVLVRTPMPCAGIAECGICAVKTRGRNKIKYSCKDGPVFNLNNLEEE